MQLSSRIALMAAALAAAGAALAFSQDTDTAKAKSPSVEGIRYPIVGWSWIAGDSPEMADPGYDDSGWDKLELPSQVKPGKPLSAFWLR